MFYGMSCGRRKRNVRRLLHILLRACECARVWFVRKIHTEAGKQEIFHKRERQKKGKKCRYGWKKHGRRHPQNAKDSGWKIGMTEKKHGRSLHKTGRKKCSGNRKIPEWLIKNGKWHPQNAKDSGWKIGMTGKKHGGRLHKTGKKTLREPQNAGIVEKFLSGESSRRENPFREMWIFPPESPEKSGKIMDMERKISHTARKKAWNKSGKTRRAA